MNRVSFYIKVYTAKAYYSHRGDVNYQCLLRNPDFSLFANANGESGSYTYGTEYKVRSSPLMPSSREYHYVPCAVLGLPETRHSGSLLRQ